MPLFKQGALGPLFALALCLGGAILLVADELTLTTYYPSPYGVYEKMRTRGDTYLAVSNGAVGVGTPSAAPGVKLHVAGAMRIEDGSQGTGKVLTSDGFGNASWQNAAGVPPGAVMFFNLAACPSGWTELVAARGRYVVGLPAGGGLALAVGTALANGENRAVGQHTHGITDPGHSHLYTAPNYTSTGSGGSKAGIQGPTATSVDPTGITINAAGTVAGTNAPYIQLLICQKD